MAIKAIRVVVDKVKQFAGAVKMLSSEAVYIGVPDTKDTRKPDSDKPADEPFGNAAIGYLNEYGSPAQNIPARPHMRPGIETVRKEIAEELEAGAKALLTGRTDAVRTAYNRVGIIGVNSVRARITSGEGFAPLSIVTLLARKDRLRTGRRIQGAGELGSIVRGGLSKGPPDLTGVRNKPLIDTGQYRNSITYVIRKK